MPRPKKEPYQTRVFMEGPKFQRYSGMDREITIEIEIRLEKDGFFRSNERAFNLRCICNHYSRSDYSDPLFMGLAVPTFGHNMDLDQLKERVKWLEEVLGFARR